MIRRFWIFITIIFFIISSAIGQDTSWNNEDSTTYIENQYNEADYVKNIIDKKEIPHSRNFIHPNYIDKYNSEEFQYHTIKKINLIEKITVYIKNIFKDWFDWNMTPNAYNVIKYSLYTLMIIIIIGLVIFIIYVLKKYNSKNHTMDEDQHGAGLGYEFLQEMHSLNIASEINNAELKKDYRLAIRYQFIQLLKSFDQKGIIHFKPETPSEQYITLIEDKEYSHQYQQALYYFNEVWYGLREIDCSLYHQIINLKIFNSET